MKILLIIPAFGYGSKPQPQLSWSDFPTGFAYIAAALKEAGHKVIGLNPNNIAEESPYFTLTNQIYNVLQIEKPDLIGLGGICTDFVFIRDAIELIRKFAPGTPIVLGGGIINNDREFVFSLLKPDFGIVGEGEGAIVKLAEMVTSGIKDYGQIGNLSYWDNGQAVFTQRNHDLRPVDTYPFPDYEPFGIQKLMEQYSLATRLLYRYSRTHPRPMPIVAARGCPFNCTFCIHRGNQHYRPRSIENIMEEIRLSYEKYRFNILIIMDELFAVNKQRIKDFSEAVLAGKEKYGWDFDWLFQTHASASLDYETLALAKKAGCVFFSYGLESASPTVLRSMNKKTQLSQIIEAIHLADRAGIGFGGNLIFGDPTETQITIYESLDFFAKYGQSTFIFLSLLMPYPGSKIFDYCVEKGLIQDKATYYANIDQGYFNMTSMPDNLWAQWINFFHILERSWLWVRDTDALTIEKEDYSDPVVASRKSDIYKITARCPYCEEEIEYREMVGRNPGDWPLFLGVGCTKCNKRIKVILKIAQKLTPGEIKLAEVMA